MNADVASPYLTEIIRQMRGHKKMAESAMAQIDDHDFFRAIDPEANSVAIIVRHISGNMHSRFTDFLTTDGEKPDRFRDREFEIAAGTTRADVMKKWDDEWTMLFATLESLKPEDVMRTIKIRGEDHTVLQALNRALAHYAQHVGQIVFLAKHLRSKDWKTLSIPRGESEKFKIAAPDPRKP